MVLLVPDPTTPSGPPFIVHIPDAGRLLNTTEPVAVVQVGSVIVPTVGAPGVTGAASMCTIMVGGESQVPLLTLNV